MLIHKAFRVVRVIKTKYIVDTGRRKNRVV